MLRKNNWSHWEDELIAECMLDYARQGQKASEAFDFLAEMIPNRTPKAVELRWYTAIRPTVLRLADKEVEVAVGTEEAKDDTMKLSLNDYVALLAAPNLTAATIELVNLRIRSMI